MAELVEESRARALLNSESPRQWLTFAARRLIAGADAQLAQIGATLPLQSDQLGAVASDLAAKALIVQPAGDRTSLFVIDSDGVACFRWSDVSSGELTQLAGSLQSLLHRAAVEAATPGSYSVAEGTESELRLQAALSRLSEGLLRPVEDLLKGREPLIIVPYRELALVPFHLLAGGDGRLVCERRAISVAPSLLAAWTIRRRGSWNRPLFSHAYIAADPTVDPRFKMSRLTQARAEAKSLSSRLRRSGMAQTEITHLFDNRADRSVLSIEGS
jgi:hypothetical protein